MLMMRNVSEALKQSKAKRVDKVSLPISFTSLYPMRIKKEILGSWSRLSHSEVRSVDGG